MDVDIKWKIVLVEWDKTTGGITNVKWRVEASNREKTISIPGASRFSPDPESDNFVSLDSVTEDIVVEWVKKKTPNYLATEKRALAKLDSMMRTPEPGSGRGLPWEGVEIPKVTPKTY